MQIPIVGGAYTDRSTNLNAQTCINLFPVVDQNDGKTVLSLRGTPGLMQFANPMGVDPVDVASLHLHDETGADILDETGAILLIDLELETRAVLVANGYLYCVIHASVFKVDSAGTPTNLGEITTSEGFVTMESNGTQILIADGTTSGYIITLSTDSLDVIASADYPASESVAFQDGYFLVVEKDTAKWYISGLYDGQSWNALDYTTCESKPDNALLIMSTTHDVWVFGQTSTEVYYNSGNVDFPFDRNVGAASDIGLAALGSAIRIDGAIYFLSNYGQVCVARGFTAVPVSTPQIDYQISLYSTISDALGMFYMKDGHTFYVLTFPTADVTWVYDITTKYWHQWLSYVELSTTPGRHRGHRMAQFGLEWIIGDHTNGLLYKLKMDTYTDNSQAIIRQRATQVVFKERANVVHHSLEVDVEAGVGLIGSDAPNMILEWSDDGGHTWSNQHTASMGAAAAYTTRVRWNRLGKSRNRVYRLTTSDPVKVEILGAYGEFEVCAA